MALKASGRSERQEHALLLRDFANTVDISEGTDTLADPAALEAWLRDRRLIPAGDGTAPDTRPDGNGGGSGFKTAIALRTSLRAAMHAHHDSQQRAAGLDAAALSLPLRVAETAGGPVLVPVDGGVRGGLARLAAAIMASTADHTWERLKICAEDSCQWAFLDSSKNRSRHWCSMRECGNRAKTRAYRARRRAGSTAG